jgi:hypothetical protein
MVLEEFLEFGLLFAGQFAEFYTAASHGSAVGVGLAAHFVKDPIVYLEILHRPEGNFLQMEIMFGREYVQM